MMADLLDKLVASFGRGGASGRAGIFDDELEASKLLWAEYGTVKKGAGDGEDDDEEEMKSPARPVLTPAYDEDAVYDEVADGVDGMLGQRGSALSAISSAVATLAEKTIANINSNVQPGLADSTIASRRSRGEMSTATLVDTGDMRGAVRSEAKPGDKGWGD